jgi:hypothetical protein
VHGKSEGWIGAVQAILRGKALPCDARSRDGKIGAPPECLTSEDVQAESGIFGAEQIEDALGGGQPGPF